MSNIVKSISCGRALVEALHRRGIDRIFCVPGESYLEVLDAFYDHPDIQVVVAKHEGAAANMAEADGKLTNRPGICFVTRGPGATHGSIGVHIAQQDSTPMIMFIGQVARTDRGRDAFQEIDYRQMFGGIAKWATELDDPARLDEVMQRAFHVATSGRPGPVVISLPEDVLATLVEAPTRIGGAAPRNAPDPQDLKKIIELLGSASQPLALIGGTGWTDDGLSSFQRFSENWELPVVATFRHQDRFDNRHPNYVGHAGLGMDPKLANRLKTADLLLVFGSRLGDVASGGYTLLDVPYAKQRLVHIYPDHTDLGRVYSPELAIASSPAGVALSLANTKPEHPPVWRDKTVEARNDYLNFCQLPPQHADFHGVNLGHVVAEVSRVLPENGIVTNGAGNYAGWVHRFFSYKRSGTCIAPTNGSMGYGLPAAISAKLRRPKSEVVCFAGDGCFLMYAQELATAAQYGANIIVIIANNGMYGTIRMYQENRFPGRPVATKIEGPDFVQFAKSFGAHAECVERTEDFPAAFERARASKQLAVIELKTDPAQITPQLRVSAMPT